MVCSVSEQNKSKTYETIGHRYCQVGHKSIGPPLEWSPWTARILGMILVYQYCRVLNNRQNTEICAIGELIVFQVPVNRL